MGNVRASDIADLLLTPFYGINLEVKGVSSKDNIKKNTLVFLNAPVDPIYFKGYDHVCFIVHEHQVIYINNAFIPVKQPRLSFAKVVKKFFEKEHVPFISPTVVYGRDVIFGDKISIGVGTVIGDNVTIGARTRIGNNVTIGDGVKIGKNCLIRSNSVIGEKGFGFDFAEDRTPVEIPHIGGVIIGDHVEVGNFTSICAGTIRPTEIHSHVKIDNLVHIAHNCIIGEKTLIIAGAEISGSVMIGRRSWIGPKASIREKILIGNDCVVGIGSNVVNNINSHSVVYGNPARKRNHGDL